VNKANNIQLLIGSVYSTHTGSANSMDDTATAAPLLKVTQLGKVVICRTVL